MTRKELNEKYDKPIDRIRHMSNGQILIRSLLVFAFLAIVSMAVYLVINGMPVIGVPGKNSIVQAEVILNKQGLQSVVIEDEERIEYARNIVSYLGTKLGSDNTLDAGEPDVTIKYTTKSGKVVEISANEKYLFFNGKVKQLKRESMFVFIAEGIFFPELNQ